MRIKHDITLFLIVYAVVCLIRRPDGGFCHPFKKMDEQNRTTDRFKRVLLPKKDFGIAGKYGMERDTLFRQRRFVTPMLRNLFLFCSLACTLLLTTGTLTPSFAAKRVSASIIIDADTGTVLHAENADALTYPASLTKIMTLYLAFDALERGKITLNTRFKVSKHAAKQSPTKLGLKAGDTIRVIDLIRAIAIKSANDAAVVMAEGLSGSEGKFASAMTVRARQLGMRSTTFRNASGLPHASQRTTATDMAILGRAILRGHAKYYPYFGETEFTYAGKTIKGHNSITASYRGADGLKTGYINASGYNLVSSAKRDGKRLVGVVLGGSSTSSRDDRMATLLDAGFAYMKSGGRSGVLMADARKRKLQDLSGKVAVKPAKKAPVTTKVAAVTTTPATVKKTPTSLPQRGKKASATTTIAKKTGKTWGIQVGAFGSKAPAQTELANVTKSLGSTLASGKGTVVSFKSGKTMLYRARVVGISENQARTACKKLSAGKKSCHVISPAA